MSAITWEELLLIGVVFVVQALEMQKRQHKLHRKRHMKRRGRHG